MAIVKVRISVAEIRSWTCKRCRTSLCQPFGVGVVTDGGKHLVQAPGPTECRCGPEFHEVLPISFETREAARAEMLEIVAETGRLGHLNWLPLIRVS